MKFTKLSPYGKAELWSSIKLTAQNLVLNSRNHQDSAQFYIDLDRLRDLEKKLREHEVAVTIEKGEKA